MIYFCNRLHLPVTSTLETRTSGVNGPARRGALLVAPEDLRALCCTPDWETAIWLMSHGPPITRRVTSAP